MEGLTRIEIFNIHEDYYVEGVKVVSCHIFYPQFIGPNHALDAINERYYHNAVRKKEYCTNVMYPSAMKSYLLGSKALPYEMVVTITITLQTNEIVSFYQEEYLYTGGANGNTTRVGQTVDITNAQIMHLCDFMKNKESCETCVKHNIIEQIKDSKDPSIYFDDFPSLVEETFHAKNFYLTSEGVVVFFALYDIAPHSTGIPTFIIPYHEC